MEKTIFENGFKEIAKICEPADTYIIGPILYFLAKLIKAETTLEIGLGDGYVSFLLCHASKKHYAIERRLDRCEKFKKLLKDKGIENTTVINDLSQSVSWNIEVDLIFQDSAHRLPGIEEEVNKFAPFVKKNGLFCLHDYCWEPGDVKQVVDKKFDDGWQVLTIPFNLGVTICRKL